MPARTRPYYSIKKTKPFEQSVAHIARQTSGRFQYPPGTVSDWRFFYPSAILLPFELLPFQTRPHGNNRHNDSPDDKRSG